MPLIIIGYMSLFCFIKNMCGTKYTRSRTLAFLANAFAVLLLVRLRRHAHYAHVHDP